MEGKGRVNPDCVNASNPFHVCAEYCIQRAQGSTPRSPGPKLVVAAQNGVRRKEDRGVVVAERIVDPSCPNASNPYHQCAEYCSARNPEVKGQNEEKRSVEKGVKMEGTQKKKEEIKHTEGGKLDVVAQNRERHKEDPGIVVAERNADPSCPNAYNPYHQCAECCSPRKAEVKQQNEKKRSVENGMKKVDYRMVDPRCANASNPFHVCAEYCFQKMKEMEHAGGGKSVVAAHHERRGGLKTMEREGVHPDCVNASNPFHKCSECCFQKANQLT